AAVPERLIERGDGAGHARFVGRDRGAEREGPIARLSEGRRREILEAPDAERDVVDAGAQLREDERAELGLEVVDLAAEAARRVAREGAAELADLALELGRPRHRIAEVRQNELAVGRGQARSSVEPAGQPRGPGIHQHARVAAAGWAPVDQRNRGRALLASERDRRADHDPRTHLFTLAREQGTVDVAWVTQGPSVGRVD